MNMISCNIYNLFIAIILLNFLLIPMQNEDTKDWSLLQLLFRVSNPNVFNIKCLPFIHFIYSFCPVVIDLN